MPEETAMMDPESGFCSCEPVLLQPFNHQVGGTSCMLRFNETTLCKPLIPREHDFYQVIPDGLKAFTPEYRGVIDVQLQEHSDGYITLIGYPTSIPDSDKLCTGQKPPSPASSGSDTDSPVLHDKKKHDKSVDPYSVRLLRSGSIEVSSQTDKLYSMEDPRPGKGSRTEGMNPWSLKCHKRQLSKMMKVNKETSYPNKFILLENVAAKCCYPCILDLKMGTRQHGDDVSEAKKKSHMLKCEKSTSKHIGVRICGTQVYQANTGKYACRNKYYGRSLSVEGFQQELRQFIHNGLRLRVELIGDIVKKLERLSRRIKQQDTFRFYSSSLLIMYDGLSVDNPQPTKVPSMELHEDSDSNASTMSESEKSGNEQYNSHWASSQGPYVDVRMIDFAHSTHSGFHGDKTVHQGFDAGYLFGLENLISYFKAISETDEMGS